MPCLLGLKQYIPGPLMNRLKWFFKMFRYPEDILLRSSKFACLHSQ